MLLIQLAHLMALGLRQLKLSIKTPECQKPLGPITLSSQVVADESVGE